jgi:trehalose 6-phosphate synthase
MALTSVDQVEKHVVMVQDYHLLLCPRFLRESGAGFFITHFLHTPWPQSDYWKVLPRPLFQSIFESLLAADIVGFHERNYGLNFLQGCERFLPEARVNYINWTVKYRDRETWIRFYPISVDVAMTRALAADPKVAEERTALEFPGRKVILRVDRADLSKNVVRGFAAYATLLRDHPELQGRVIFLALLNLTREELPKYKTYLEEIYDIVERVNRRYGAEDWQPVELRVEDRFEQSVAGFQRYDVLFVTPLFDGMNLVAKKGPILNERSGVTVLSENAGAYKQLKPWVIGVSPFDVQGMADALWRAATMAEEERRLRLRGMVKHIQANDISKWIMDQLRDMEFKLRIPA